MNLGKWITDGQLVVNDLSMVRIFGEQYAAPREQRRRGNQCVIKRKSISFDQEQGMPASR